MYHYYWKFTYCNFFNNTFFPNFFLIFLSEFRIKTKLYKTKILGCYFNFNCINLFVII